MNDIIQFQLSDQVINISASKIVHDSYQFSNNIIKITMDNGDEIMMEIDHEQYQLFDTARNKLIIIEDKDVID